MGCGWKGTSLKRAGRHPPTRAHAPRVGGNPKGGAPLAWGASPLPSRSHLEGPPPFPLRPINRGVEGGQPHHIQGVALPLSNTSSSFRGAWRSPAGDLPLHHHHTVVLLLEPSSSTSPSSLLDQGAGDVSAPYVC